MRKWLLLVTASAALHAAVIRGNVVEDQTGHPLARAIVGIEPVGTGAAPQSVRTNAYGAFEFPALPAGVYVVTAARLAFAPIQYGQKTWHSSGTPIKVTDNDATEITIRLPRYGAIAGTVLDENEVGLPDHEVAVYTNARPPRLLARARTDDRGMYRLFGLQPGSYLVRSMSKMYEDGGYLPTFYRDASTVDLAHSVDVTLDQQVDRVDFHAAPGRLFTVAGRVLSGQGQAVVALASDTGTEYGTIDAMGTFTFDPMAPGQYEMLAQGPPDRFRGQMAAYQALTVDKDLNDLRIVLSPMPTVQFVFEDTKGQPIDSRQLRLLARRKDVAGDAQTQTLQVAFDDPPPPSRVRRAGTPEPSNNDPVRPVMGKVTLLPGRWDVALAPTASLCVMSYTGPQESTSTGRADGWNEMLLPSGSQNIVKFVLSSSPATLSGTVKNSAGDPVAGIPIFLEPTDLDPARRLAAVRSARTNAQGQYGFAGLAPGQYRLLATFDYRMPDSNEMEAAGARSVKLEEGVKTVFDLDQFVLR